MLARPGHERPNILVILSDDHHFRALGAAGNEAIHTPALDRLAGEGAFFPCCYVSNPTSSPSRACLWTGQYGFRNGAAFAGQAMRADAPRLPRLLSDFGYTTGHTGKWHNEGRPADHGFRYMRHVFLGSMHPYDRIPVVEGARDRPHEIPGNPTDTFTTGAIDLLDHALQEPFALFVCYTAPHDPRTPPAEFEGMYSPERLSLPRNFSPEPPFDPGTLALRDETLLERPLRKEEVLRETARYFGMISHLDAQIGRLLAHLRGTGQLDRTVVFYTSDSGLALGAHGLLGKQTMHEEGVRAPLIVRGPGVEQGTRGEAMVDVMDLMPTICDLARIPIPGPVQGRTLTPVLAGRRTAHRRSVFAHFSDLLRMVRTEEHKVIAHLKTKRAELYNLHEDPFELRDLSRSPAHKDLVHGLIRQLAETRAAVGEPVSANSVRASLPNPGQNSTVAMK